MVSSNSKPLIVVLALAVLASSSGDYIQSNELILGESIAAGSELINLNKLIRAQKPASASQKTYTFKLVNDTPLFNYVELKHLNSDTTLVVLARQIDFASVCDQVPLAQSCAHTLKLVVINENDFIEIPVEVRRVKTRPSLRFPQTAIYLNATGLVNTFPLIVPSLQVGDEPRKLTHIFLF